MNINTLKNQKGSVLVSLVVTIPFLILIAASYISLSGSSYRNAKKDQLHTFSQLAADAASDYAIEQVNADENWIGTPSEVELQNSNNIKTTFTVTVTSIDSNNKNMLVTGRTYWPATSSTVSSTVKLNVGLRSVTSGEYSVVSGVGGLSLTNSAKILGGDVFVNGTVTLSNSAQIGLTSSPVTLEVAQQSCPVGGGASYPTLCGAGEAGDPITLNNTSHIYGTVKANNQTDGSNMTNPGLISSSGVVPQALPNHDRDAQKAAIATTITGAAASCSGSQTKTWAANTKITGDVTVSNQCKITVSGDIWITGSLTTGNSSQLIVSDSLGTTRPNIMIDSITGADFSQSTKLVSNSASTGFQILTYYSAASCSPDCSDVTGQDLYDSRNANTITIDNSASGPQTLFYARWTAINVVNSGQIGALIGQTVKLSNSGTITFGTSVGSETKFWIINGYRRTF